MGGFVLPVQSFFLYQALDWVSSSSGSLENQIKGVARLRDMIDCVNSDEYIKLGIVSRLVELLEKTSNTQLQVTN